jgi:DNA-binding transcriptional regulator YiaG
MTTQTPTDLKATRLRLGFKSRRALAEAIGVTKWAVDSWESDRRPIPAWVPKILDCLIAAGEEVTFPVKLED